MKKLFLIALCALSLSACADNKQVITFDQLPTTAQTMLSQYVDVKTILIVTKEDFGPFADYEVLTNDRSEWVFDADGSLESVKMYTGVPDALVPEVIRTQVNQMYPNTVITKYSIDKRDQEVELINGIELTFDKAGRLLEADID